MGDPAASPLWGEVPAPRRTPPSPQREPSRTRLAGLNARMERLARVAAAIAGEGGFGMTDVQLLVDHPQRTFHGHWAKPSRAVVDRVVQRSEEQQHGGDDRYHRAHQESL